MKGIDSSKNKKWRDKKYKKVYSYSFIDENILEFECIHRASEKMNVTPTKIVSCCRNRDLSTKGIIWAYNLEELKNKIENFPQKPKNVILNRIKKNYYDYRNKS